LAPHSPITYAYALEIHQFAENFLSNGEKGGQDAADELNRQVNDYMKTLSIDDASTKVMVRAYANVKGLQDACRSNGKMKNAASLDRFVHGFNRRQALFDFVDVGPWKEGADNKIRGNWKPRPSSRV